MIKSFSIFIDKKKRESLKQLGVIEEVLKSQGFNVRNYLSEGDAGDHYIFVYNDRKNTSFDGVRIYKIGSTIAFRVQNESETHPFGTAYSMNIEQLFNDLMAEEEMDEMKAGKIVVEAIAKELKTFFVKSGEAEEEERSQYLLGDESLAVRSSGGDYSNHIYSGN